MIFKKMFKNYSQHLFLRMPETRLNFSNSKASNGKITNRKPDKLNIDKSTLSS